MLPCVITVFSLSIIIIVTFFVSIFVLLKKRKKRMTNDFKVDKADIQIRHTFFTPFKVFIIVFFFAASVMSLPVYYNGIFASDVVVVKELKSGMMSALNALKMFFLNADFETVKNVINEKTVPAGMAIAYTIYFAALYIVAPFLSFGFVLSFFKDFYARVKYRLRTRSDIYILSEINDRSMALAKDIFYTERGKRKLVVFADAYREVDEKEKGHMDDLIAEAKRLGFVCLKNDITEIRLKHASKYKKYESVEESENKNRKRKFYFISEDEDKNLNQAINLIDHCRSLDNYNNGNTQFYVFANSAGSELFLDSIDNGEMRVRRVMEYWNTMLNTLQEHSIVKTAVQNGNEKEINLLVVGVGNYGTELIKMACWMGQMPGYKVYIHAFDNFNIEDKFNSIAPAFVEMNKKRIEGQPYYHITFHNNVDVKSAKFFDELDKIDHVTSAFVSLGNDELNIETALKVKAFIKRKKFKLDDGSNPPIYTIVYNSNIFKNRTLIGAWDVKYDNINFIDGITSRYTLKVVERKSLEDDGLACHMQWAKTYEEKEDAKRAYGKYEYFRKSSIATCAHTTAMNELGIYETDENGIATAKMQEYEHKRWCAYMRGEGYVSGDEKDSVAKTHPKIVKCQELNGEDWKRDAIVKSSHKK